MKGIARADVGLFILRLGLGLTMLFFGSQKVFGLFGGYGYSATVSVFHDKMGIPIVLAHIGILGEFLGGGGVLLGFLTPLASFGVMCTMAVATFISIRGPGVLAGIFEGAKGADPSKLFFSGFLCIAALSLMLLGPGKISLDAKFFRKSKR